MPQREIKLRTQKKKKKKTYDGVKESGLADVWKTDDSGFQAHAYFRGETSLLQSQNSDQLGGFRGEEGVVSEEMMRL